VVFDRSSSQLHAFDCLGMYHVRCVERLT
jgi:hypothetical protein